MEIKSLSVETNLLVEILLIPMPCTEDINSNLLLHWSFELKRQGLRMFRKLIKNGPLYKECGSSLNRIIRNTNLGHHIQWYIEQILFHLHNSTELQLIYKWEKGIPP